MNYKYINFILVVFSVFLLFVVEILLGYEVIFFVNGIFFLNIIVMKNFIVLFIGVESVVVFIFYEEGKFMCMVRNLFGFYFKEFFVIFGGMNWLC